MNSLKYMAWYWYAAAWTNVGFGIALDEPFNLLAAIPCFACFVLNLHEHKRWSDE